MSVAAWASCLPDVHPFLVDMAQTIDRTIARFECRIGILQAELVQLRVALAASSDPLGSRARRAKLAAYQQEIAEYQATISECRKQFESQVAKKWTAAEIALAKSRAVGLSDEPVVTA